jgi:hypothetical protein
LRWELHREILSQLYAMDINSLPVHITVMRDVGHPTGEVNIVANGFFKVLPYQKVCSLG